MTSLILSDSVDHGFEGLERALAAKLPPTPWRIGVARALYEALPPEDIQSAGLATHPFDALERFSGELWPVEESAVLRAWANANVPRFTKGYPWRKLVAAHGPFYPAALPMPAPAIATMKAALAKVGAVGCALSLIVERVGGAADESCIGFLLFHTRIPEDVFIARNRALALRASALVGAKMVAALALAREIDAPRTTLDLSVLTPREREVVELAAQGHSDLNVAAHLGISEATVGTHLHRAFRKLGLHTRVELARALGSPRS